MAPSEENHFAPFLGAQHHWLRGPDTHSVVQTPAQIWLGIGLIAFIWASTFLRQVPAHSQLGSGFDEGTWRMLVRSNWLRTIAWSVRAGLVTY